MKNSIKDKTFLVTGANRGLGQAIVEALLNRGAGRIYATARKVESLVNIQALAPSLISPVQLDVTNVRDIHNVAKLVKSLDVLINNAGIAALSTFSDESSLKIAAEEMATNYFGPLNVTHALLPALRQSKCGIIININSIAGISNFPPLGPYSASKAALHSMTQGLRAELRSSGIFVQGVYPGPMDTDMADDLDAIKASPEEVANLILEGLEQGHEEIFPDHFSQSMYKLFLKNPKALEQQFEAALQ